MIPYPTFSEYELQSRLFGLEVSRVEYEEVLRYTEDELKDYDLVFLCNPNNPTGVLRDKDRLTQFVSRCRKVETYVLLDEAFIELFRPEESLIPSVPSFSNLVVVRSLTKEFTIPGLRIGYGIVPVEIANNVEKLRPPWNLNTLASAVGSRFLRTEKELLLDLRNYLAGERSWLKDRLEDLRLAIGLAVRTISLYFVTLPKLAEKALQHLLDTLHSQVNLYPNFQYQVVCYDKGCKIRDHPSHLNKLLNHEE